MSLNDKIRSGLNSYLTQDSSSPPVNKSNRRTLSPDDVADFEYQADHREDSLWEEIEALLSELERGRPIRTAKMRQDIRWLRRQAKKRNLRWGK